jgi:ATP-binding cassette subfamily B (MDR/TAP) protein 1
MAGDEKGNSPESPQENSKISSPQADQQEDNQHKENTEEALLSPDVKKGKVLSEKELLKAIEEELKTRSASFGELFSQADWQDYVMMIIGSCASMVTGASLPFVNFLFGDILDSLSGDPNGFTDAIKGLVFQFLWVSLANMVSSTVQLTMWSMAGERQTQKLRESYVRAILSQEIGYFDTCGAAALSTKVADLTGKVQDGITRKVADLIQFAATFISSFIIGFYFSWKLSLVLLASFPLIAGAGAFMINAITQATEKGGEQYAEAGSLSTEVLNAVPL